jgi:hypothetical protein
MVMLTLMLSFPEMGYHYLKMDNLNATFEYAKT